MIYVALLRGINVGGNSKVSMTTLKVVFEKLGHENIKTFINSGNVIFTSNLKNADIITKDIEAGIKKEFGFDVPVLVKDFKSMQSIVKAIPEKWVNNADMKCDVMFLWKDIDKPSVEKEFPLNPDIEDFKYTKGAAIWRIDRKHATKSKMFKIVGTKLYKSITARNPNSVRKIFALMEAINQ